MVFIGILKKRPTHEQLLLEDIRSTSRALETAHQRFRQETDNDLISSYIYEIMALKARYSYLIKIAKQLNLQGGVIIGGYERTDYQ